MAVTQRVFHFFFMYISVYRVQQFKIMILNIFQYFLSYSEYSRKGGMALFLFRVKNGESNQIVLQDLLPKSSLSKYSGHCFLFLRETLIRIREQKEKEKWKESRELEVYLISILISQLNLCCILCRINKRV